MQPASVRKRPIGLTVAVVAHRRDPRGNEGVRLVKKRDGEPRFCRAPETDDPRGHGTGWRFNRAGDLQRFGQVILGRHGLMFLAALEISGAGSVSDSGSGLADRRAARQHDAQADRHPPRKTTALENRDHGYELALGRDQPMVKIKIAATARWKQDDLRRVRRSPMSLDVTGRVSCLKRRSRARRNQANAGLSGDRVRDPGPDDPDAPCRSALPR